MLDGLIITEAEAAGLSRLAALDLGMAEDFAARAQAAQDPDTANDLARSYQRMARSYRQSLALKVRLQHEIARAEREALEGQPPAPPKPLDPEAVQARVDAVRSAARRVIWSEYEPLEDDGDDGLCAEFSERLDRRLAALRRQPEFGQEPLNDHILEVCRAVGLDAALAISWRSLPEPPDDAFPESNDDPAPDWRGSG
jgi:hypothetical protein